MRLNRSSLNLNDLCSPLISQVSCCWRVADESGKDRMWRLRASAGILPCCSLVSLPPPLEVSPFARAHGRAVARHRSQTFPVAHCAQSLHRACPQSLVKGVIIGRLLLPASAYRPDVTVQPITPQVSEL